MYTASRNPYEQAELFTMLENLRRKDELDSKSDNELGELLMSTTKFAITCFIRSGQRLHDAPDEMESEVLTYVIEVSRKANTVDPRKFVNCLVKSAQNRIRWMLRDTRRHNDIVSPTCDVEPPESACDIDGTSHVDIYEQIKLFSRKEKIDG